MASNADALVREGIKAYREGKKDEARDLLLQAVEINDQNEQAWMWLSAVVDTAEDQQTCLENVLTINPNNEKAKQGLLILSEKASGSAAVSMPTASAAPSAPTQDDDPFAQVSFTQTEPTAQATEQAPPPLVEDDADDDEEDELPSDTSWGSIATSSASALPHEKIEPSADEYDDWVAGLNLGNGGESAQLFGDAPTTSNNEEALNTSPFIGAESLFDEEPLPDVDDSPFGISDDLLPDVDLGQDDEDDDEAFSARSFMMDTDFEEAFEEEDEAAFDLPEADPEPTVEDELDTADELFLDDLGDDSDFDEGLYDDFDDAEFDEVDPEELFRFIPADIKATRLPGTRERYPALVIIGFLLLLVLNVGAIAMVFITLTTG